MKNYSRAEIAVLFKETGLVPLFYDKEAETVKKVVKALYEGGARLFEFTSRGDFAHEVFSEVVKYSQKECPEMLLGVGSVTDGAEASRYIAMGAKFVVSPVFRKDVVKVCNRRKVLYLPGCGTLEEIGKAEEWGCEIVKLFPASVYEPEFVKAVMGPQPWTAIMPSGGVTTERDNLKAWFDAGVTCVGMGSSLIKKNISTEKDFNELQNKVSRLIQVISELR
ncbi:bifunctional 4-hydroxy-2-oxoglutarate aldolase/2-dehydro-3-deoxy-phosphogluconate aldolase [Gramella sp. GC03-9]|uniref:Bifunctional 4-hydroxy-2-oxoglutarate aldolase/2-dehydro-3-deoxy-phosphogluconate aldolase n=1 Tax=Christiangramia oceanisediminis TaxID=2920386 RepID=A0A9X2I487_9FLAO|nr:bifunctional 4-hydroxy-2-oxoglutarate aldolase/2-dehydro-3-deoxy-phosphogluconate aldolase [Gramella oceanisediminis]MCP9199082.1 bifunctional 4-hydroxy-2-oxoglutarate aldolase/2-dehydro-3-deoxy-phosphogluconate aldolase [Gramella oceanisediminis]